MGRGAGGMGGFSLHLRGEGEGDHAQCSCLYAAIFNEAGGGGFGDGGGVGPGSVIYRVSYVNTDETSINFISNTSLPVRGWALGYRGQVLGL